MKPQSAKIAAAPQISWENILTSLEDGVIVIDGRGKISFYNQAAEMLTDLSASQALQQSYPRLSLFKRNSWLLDMIKKSQQPDPLSTRGEGDLITQWGRQTPVGVTVSPL
ncbi:MAG: PAS domain-containing protein [Candidatus Binatia bacterium]